MLPRLLLTLLNNSAMSLTKTHPIAKPANRLKNKPSITLIHSENTTPSIPFNAIAPPVIPAIKECDLDAGIPQNQQKVPHAMLAIKEAIKANKAI